MSGQNSNIESIDFLYKDSVKAARIYELILENINFDKIKDAQIETEELNAMNPYDVLNYINNLSDKKDNTEGKIDNFTKYFKNMLSPLISAISIELETQKILEMTNNLLKLSAYYYLFKIKTSNDVREITKFMAKIDDVVDNITSAKDDYYNILFHLDIVKKIMFEVNKFEIIDGYFTILLYLNEAFFTETLDEFMKKKSSLYPQYKIEMPLISFEENELKKNIKKIYKILIILEKTENFKTNERFEYFQTFKNQNDLLEEINYILFKQNKKPLISLDMATNDITEEAIQYSLDKSQKISNDADIISELKKTLEIAKNKRNEYKTAYEDLNKKHSLFFNDYKKLENEYKKLDDEYKKLDANYEKDLSKLESKIVELNKIKVENNEKINKQKIGIKSIEEKLGKTENIIEKISYIEIGSKIIKFFSFSMPEDKIKEHLERNVSPTNIDIIIDYFKNNLSDYYNYLKSNNTDLKYVLKEIKIEKKDNDKLVHDREINLDTYIKLMSEKDKQLGDQIKFIFTNSNLLLDYVFNKNNQIKDKAIRDEFRQKNEEFKKLIKEY